MQPLSQIITKSNHPKPATAPRPQRELDPWEQEERAAAHKRFLDARLDTWKRICPADYLETDVSRLAAPSDAVLALQMPQDTIGLLLSGETGHGKTRTALMLVARHFCSRSISFKYCTGIDLADDILGAYQEGGIKNLRLDMETVDMLLIDDLFKGNWKPSVEALLFNLFEHRISRRKPTIITTNSDGNAIKKLLSADMKAPFLRRIGGEFFMPFKFMKKPAPEKPA